MSPGDSKVINNLIELYLWNNQPHMAYMLMKKIAGFKSGKKEVLIRSAEIAEDAGLLNDAYIIYKRLYRDFPEDSDIRERLIRICNWTGRELESAQIIGRISDRSPGDLSKAIRAVEAYIRADRVIDAIRYLERAVSIEPESTRLRRRLIKYYRWINQREKLIHQLRYLEANNKISPDERLELASYYLDKKMSLKTINILEVFLKDKRMNRKAGLMLGSAYEISGKQDRAVEMYLRLYKENRNDPVLLSELGNRALWINRTDIALKFYLATLRLDPINKSALKGSAQIYAWRNQTRKAIKQFERYLRIIGDDYEARYMLGELYDSSGRRADAIKQYRKALKILTQLRVAGEQGDK